jgi:hypothetical protein
MEIFDDIDAFLMTKHNVTPPCLVDTMAESKHQVAEDNSSLSGMGKT